MDLNIRAVGLVLLIACGASSPPPSSQGLPDRSALGAEPSPLAENAPRLGVRVSTGQLGGPKSDWNRSFDILANDLAQGLRWDGRNRMKVAVLDFVEAHGGECSLGAPAAEDLTTSLFATNQFEIIERRMLDRVLRENQASQSDLYDPEYVARLGGLLGADGIVTGTVSSSQRQYSFNTRVIIAESARVVAAARAEVQRSDAEGRGTCGDVRQVIAAPPPSR